LDSSSQQASGISKLAKSIVCSIRSGRLTPTIVPVMRGSRSENCSAAAARGTSYRPQIASS
jgi:hypothetical protein